MIRQRNRTEHGQRQEKRAQVLYYTESESFPEEGVARGKIEGNRKSLNPQSQTGVALANGN